MTKLRIDLNTAFDKEENAEKLREEIRDVSVSLELKEGVLSIYNKEYQPDPG